MDLSLVLPCYHEGPRFIFQVRALGEWLAKQSWRSHLLLVEDGGQDDTRQRMDSLPDTIQGVPIQKVYRPENGGRGAAVRDGFRRATGAYCGFIDVDMEVDFRWLTPAIHRLKQGVDGVVGHRSYSLGDPRPDRVLYSLLYRKVARQSLRLPVADSECGFKLFRRDRIIPVIEQTIDCGWFFDTELVYRAAKAGLWLENLRVKYQRDPEKRSTVLPFRDGSRSLRALIHLRYTEGPCR